MYCTRCGVQTGETAKFCAQCGAVAPGASSSSSLAVPVAPQMIEAGTMLTRSLRNRKIAGVCGGIARHFGVDPTIVRILFVAMFFCPVLPAIVPYIVCWAVMPLERPEPLQHSAAYSMGPNLPLTSMSR
jgi:phage shock protein C